jgi:ATP-binding cassette subfamily B protein
LTGGPIFSISRAETEPPKDKTLPPRPAQAHDLLRLYLPVKYLPRVFAYLRPYWKLVSVSVICTILISAVGLAAPWPMKFVIDSVVGNEPLPAALARLGAWAGQGKVPFLLVAVCSGLVLSLITNGLSVLQSYVTTTFEQKMILDFRSDMFQHAQRLSLAFHDQRRSGMIIYAINYQADAAAGVVMAAQPIAQSILTLFGMFWITFELNRTLALLSLTVVPFLYASVGYYARNIQSRILGVNTLEAESLAIIHESMSMLRVIVAFCREPFEFGRFRKQGETAVAARIRVTLRQTVFGLIVNTITAAGSSLVLGYGAYQALNGKLTAGDLVVVVTYIAAVYSPLESISTTIGSLQNQFVGLKIACGLMDTAPEIQNAPNARTIERAEGHVRFENVQFSYTGRVDTLKNLSFEAQPGQVIAVAGPTGAGKTTLMSLLPRFYDPKGGRILLDGVDIQDLTLESLRRQISIVLQEPLLFSDSIAANIRYGRLDATMEEITEAAKSANAHDFITAFPDQYETVLGERGAKLSGGERQRIALARAFLKDAPILILDEPTSSIDSKTELVILDALDRLMLGRTTFMIAHRLSTIRNADQILIMHHGEIVERGTHDELLAQRGLYRELYDMQKNQPRLTLRQRMSEAAAAPVSAE